MLPLPNATRPLTTPTHDGSGQATHPCVIDFLTEHNMESWAGYRYWMAMTPYPQANEAHEDPNLIASNDGQVWVVPDGLMNPLDDAPGVGAEYNADTEMVYNPDTDELWVYYRYYRGSDQLLELRLVRVRADMTYSDPQAVITIRPATLAVDFCRSPVIWRESANKWHMWGQGGARPYGLYYSFSEDGLNWGTFTRCLDKNSKDPFHEMGWEAWHPGGKPNIREGRMEFLVSSWELGGWMPKRLIYAEVPFDNPTLISTPISDPIVQTKDGSWDNVYIYRSTFTVEAVDDDYLYRIWYSARGGEGNNTWRIGYTEGFIHTELLDTLPVLGINGVEHLQVIPFSANEPVRIMRADGMACLRTVPTTHPEASTVRVMTLDGVRAIAKVPH